MKGLELCKKFYFEHGEPMLKGEFPEILDKIAVGLMGSGSECLGYDDEISQDHDFEGGFCIFLPGEDIVDRRVAFKLERAYAKLPKEFMGFKRSPLSPVGGNRHGVIRMADFFTDKTGSPDGTLSTRDWLCIPEQALLEATNGCVFFDGLGELSKIRESLSYLPEDIRLKKLAGHLLNMGQAGQYNFSRCIGRQDTAGAQMAVFELVKSALCVIFLLNKRYIPYYKWSFRALLELDVLSSLHAPLEYLISSGNTPDLSRKKQEIIESVCSLIIDELRTQGLSDYYGEGLEGHAYSVNNHIKSSNIRNLHILCAI